jgi:hypothetical protein
MKNKKRIIHSAIPNPCTEKDENIATIKAYVSK